jgi:hypothetical protein
MRKVELRRDDSNNEWRVLFDADTERSRVMCWCNVGLPCHEGCAAFYEREPRSGVGNGNIACSALPLSGGDDCACEQEIGHLVESPETVPAP